MLYNGDWIVNLGDEYDIRDTKKLGAIIEKVFLTESGKRLATETCLGTPGEG